MRYLIAALFLAACSGASKPAVQAAESAGIACAKVDGEAYVAPVLEALAKDDWTAELDLLKAKLGGDVVDCAVKAGVAAAGVLLPKGLEEPVQVRRGNEYLGDKKFAR